MIRVIVLLAGLGIVPLLSNAQEFRIGPQVGINVSRVQVDGASSKLKNKLSSFESAKKISGDDISDAIGFKLGFDRGGAIGIGISELFSVKVGFQYSGKGFTLNHVQQEDGENGSIKVDYDLDVDFTYLHVPLLPRLTFGDDTKFYIQAGPYVGYNLEALINGKQTYTENSESKTKKFDNESLDDINKLDLGATVGAGVLIEAGPGDIMIEANYEKGLISLLKGSDDSITNNLAGLYTGYLFSF